MNTKPNIMNKILVSPSSFGQISNEPYEILEKEGYEVIKNPYGRKLTENEVIELASECIGIVAGVEPLTRSVIEQLPKLRCISRVGVGMDSVDLDFARTQEIQVVNTPDGPTRSVAEMTIGMLFSILRRIPQAHANIKNGIWKKETGNLLFGKKIGIVGLGRIGKMVAEFLIAIGNEVMGYDIDPDLGWAKKNRVAIVSLETVFEKSDIISLHLPPDKSGLHIINGRLLRKMKQSAFLVNAARGGVVDELELQYMLETKAIAGAAIDVFSEEPYHGPLIKLDNVVLTPHLGSYAAEGKLQMEIDSVNNLIENLK